MDKVEECLSIICELIKGKDPESSSSVDKHCLLLYYYSLYQVFGNDQDRPRVQAQIEKILVMLLSEDDISDTVLSFPILRDLVKEGFVDSKLEKKIIELDNRLFNQASSLLESGNLAFVGGAAGILNHYAERLPNAQVESYMNKLLPLVNVAFVEQYFSSSSYKKVSLGISKGLSGGLMVLIKAYKMNIKDESLITTIRKGILQVIEFRAEIDFAEKRYSIFPTGVNLEQNSPNFSNQLSWSGSDLNQSLLFYRAFELFNDVELKKMADLVGLNTLLRKDKDSTGITDSHFDHGASGVAQIYKTLYTISNHQTYREGYEFWIKRTIELIEDESERGFYANQENNFSQGLIVVALTLISYVNKRNNKQELSWAKCFLL